MSIAKFFFHITDTAYVLSLNDIDMKLKTTGIPYMKISFRYMSSGGSVVKLLAC